MTRVAVIEDDPPTSHQLRGWIEAARPGIRVDQWFSRDEAEAAIARERYDLVVLDIELGRERNAGVAIINAINKQRGGTPVLVVSAMPAAIYRSIMKALDAWTTCRKPASTKPTLSRPSSTSCAPPAIPQRAGKGLCGNKKGAGGCGTGKIMPQPTSAQPNLTTQKRTVS